MNLPNMGVAGCLAVEVLVTAAVAKNSVVLIVGALLVRLAFCLVREISLTSVYVADHSIGLEVGHKVLFEGIL